MSGDGGEILRRMADEHRSAEERLNAYVRARLAAEEAVAAVLRSAFMVGGELLMEVAERAAGAALQAAIQELAREDD